MPAYQNDVKVVLNNQSKTPDNINDLIDYCNSTLQNLTDKYAPLQCNKIVTASPFALVHECITSGEEGAQEG